MADLDATVADAFQVLELVLSNAFVDLGEEGALDPLSVVRLTARRTVLIDARGAHPLTGGEIRVAAQVQVSAVGTRGADDVSQGV